MIVIGLLALAGFVNHVRFIRANARSWWTLRYFDQDKPAEWRNLPFLLLPGAVMLTIWTAVLGYTWVSGHPVLDALVALVAFASFWCGIVAIGRLHQPPKRVKPRWLVEEEARRRPR
ncbi:hypothetical protein ACQEVF_52780 [Nonomuraea polychroma]|uniref:hypothetical protein n=1 Tax=Nonomuraea polychroma TaxID=46176 RepID=UPI003D919161